MKLNRLILPALLLAGLVGCKDDNELSGLYVGDPYTVTERVTYTVSEMADSVLVEVGQERQRPTLCAVVPKGDHGIATQYGFCYSTEGVPTVYDGVITIDGSWPEAVLGLQQGVLKDTTFVALIPAGTAYVRAFLVPYPDGEVVYSGVSAMVDHEIR